MYARSSAVRIVAETLRLQYRSSILEKISTLPLRPLCSTRRSSHPVDRLPDYRNNQSCNAISPPSPFDLLTIRYSTNQSTTSPPARPKQPTLISLVPDSAYQVWISVMSRRTSRCGRDRRILRWTRSLMLRVCWRVWRRWGSLVMGSMRSVRECRSRCSISSKRLWRKLTRGAFLYHRCRTSADVQRTGTIRRDKEHSAIDLPRRSL